MVSEIFTGNIVDSVKYYITLSVYNSLIKMLYWMCEKSKKPPTGPQLQHAIKRNFGGLEDFDTYEIFKQHISNLDDQPDMTNVSEMVITLHYAFVIFFIA